MQSANYNELGRSQKGSLTTAAQTQLHTDTVNAKSNELKSDGKKWFGRRECARADPMTEI